MKGLRRFHRGEEAAPKDVEPARPERPATPEKLKGLDRAIQQVWDMAHSQNGRRNTFDGYTIALDGASTSLLIEDEVTFYSRVQATQIKRDGPYWQIDSYAYAKPGHGIHEDYGIEGRVDVAVHFTRPDTRGRVETRLADHDTSKPGSKLVPDFPLGPLTVNICERLAADFNTLLQTSPAGQRYLGRTAIAEEFPDSA